MIPNGFTFTILRDPVDAFESFFSYMGVDRMLEMDVNEFAWKYATKELMRTRDISRGRTGWSGKTN